MLELQKIFLIVRFFNWISRNKGFKAKKFNEWSENVVNGENYQFLKGNCEFLFYFIFIFILYFYFI